jgi:hypothetical protein
MSSVYMNEMLIGHDISSTYIKTNKEAPTRSGGARRASRLQRSSVASSRRQDKVIAAGGRRNGVVSEILGGSLRFFHGVGLLEVHAIQGFITIPSVEKHIGVGTLGDGTSVLAELDFVEAC